MHQLSNSQVGGGDQPSSGDHRREVEATNPIGNVQMDDLTMNNASNGEVLNSPNQADEEQKLSPSSLIGASGTPITIPTATNVRTRRMMH